MAFIRLLCSLFPGCAVNFYSKIEMKPTSSVSPLLSSPESACDTVALGASPWASNKGPVVCIPSLDICAGFGLRMLEPKVFPPGPMYDGSMLFVHKDDFL